MDIGRFISEVTLKTPEGRIVLWGSVFNVVLGAILFSFPTLTPSSGGIAAGCLFMPILLFIFHIKFGYSEDYKPSIFNSVLLAAVAAIPIGKIISSHVRL